MTQDDEMPGICPYDATDLDTMVRTVDGEAENQGIAGQVAVAWVIRNRAQHPSWYGRGIAGVCQAPEQFDCWNVGDPNRAKILDRKPIDPIYARILTICMDVLDGSTPDPTDGCLFYKVTSLPWPKSWGVQHPADRVIADQSFYLALWPSKLAA